MQAACRCHVLLANVGLKQTPRKNVQLVNRPGENTANNS